MRSLYLVVGLIVVFSISLRAQSPGYHQAGGSLTEAAIDLSVGEHISPFPVSSQESVSAYFEPAVNARGGGFGMRVVIATVTYGFEKNDDTWHIHGCYCEWQANSYTTNPREPG